MFKQQFSGDAGILWSLVIFQFSIFSDCYDIYSFMIILQHLVEIFIKMEITIDLFMCGFLLSVPKNCFSDNMLPLRMHGLVTSAGRISAGYSSLTTARKKLQEELGIALPKDAFELIFVFPQESFMNDGKYINSEYNDVYLVTTVDPIPLEALTLEETEVSAAKYISYEEYKSLLANEDSNYVPYDVSGQYGQLFHIIEKRYKEKAVARSLTLQKQISRYAAVSLNAELTGITESDREALIYIVKAAAVVDEIFYLQVVFKLALDDRSSLDDNEAFLTTTHSAIQLHPKATRAVKGWKGLEYRASFPIRKPSGANLYPPDMDKMEFEKWKDNLEKYQQKEATSFFTVIKRHSDFRLDSSSSDNGEGGGHDLYVVPYSEEHHSLLAKAAEFLHKAGDIATSTSLKRLLHSKADAFLSNDYYDSDMAWMELDSKLDITIGPYETYEDKIFGYKATFDAFIGVRDDEATAQLKLFGDNLLDVKGPQIVAFNLPNDERIVKDRGTSMVMLKNLTDAKFKLILLPIAEVCVAKKQQEFVDFNSFFTHTICHECCHGIGPHTIVLPNGQKSTVRLELQELYSAIEEAKADIVGLWALRFLVSQDLLSKTLLKSMYVSFLAGCFRSVRFGLQEAHGKGQALQFNWLYEKGAFSLHSDETFSVDFSKVEGAVESLSREILTIQAKGDKEATGLLLQKYGVITKPLEVALRKLQDVQVPVDIAPSFPIAEEMLKTHEPSHHLVK
ncbi:hypothetical protein L6164_013415 [Bauhinia variegata]|uniref:Uncharacterized protein n=1 Tax=Bauhinia variegata TaxID=167791 RepID=A0ACB9NEN1_BAUVA|nr:hypothetical protein L6164_013415 [Bauhinia variegata]